MTTNAIILAAGEAVRFRGLHKQLIGLPDGSNLLTRQVRQVYARGGTPYVATCDVMLRKWAWDHGATVIEPFLHRWTADTLLHTQGEWSRDRTLVLLGDVVYSCKVMDDLFAVKYDLAVFGNQAEVFALSFTSRYWVGMQIALREVCRQADEGRGPGKLRTFYNMMEPRPHWVQVDDYTRDFDLPEHVKAFRQEVLQAHRLDDLQPEETA